MDLASSDTPVPDKPVSAQNHAVVGGRDVGELAQVGQPAVAVGAARAAIGKGQQVLADQCGFAGLIVQHTATPRAFADFTTSQIRSIDFLRPQVLAAVITS